MSAITRSVAAALLVSIASTPALAQRKRYEWLFGQGERPIPDVGVVEFVFTIPESSPIADVDVGLLIPHTWQGDLKIDLIHGASTVLIDRPGHPERPFGFSVDNYGMVDTRLEFILDDSGATKYDVPWVTHPGIPNVTGRWLPETALSVFDGLDKHGNWILRIEDFASGDVGELRGFSIEMTNVPEPMTIGGLVLGIAMLSRRRRQK